MKPKNEKNLKNIKLRSARNEWQENTLNPAVNKFPERKSEFTSSAVPQDRIYTPLDISDTDYVDDLNFPGQFPFTRGVQPTMYRGRLWTMRQYAGFGTAKQTNERFRMLIENGQTGLSAAFDLPTQTGYDSDHPMALGEVGQVGVAIDSLRDMEEMFEDIPLDKISTSMTINAPAAVLVAMYLVAAEKQGHKYSVTTGTK